MKTLVLSLILCIAAGAQTEVRHALVLPSPEKLAGLVRSLAESGDFVILLGAGTITQWAYALPGELAALDKV